MFPRLAAAVLGAGLVALGIGFWLLSRSSAPTPPVEGSAVRLVPPESRPAALQGPVALEPATPAKPMQTEGTMLCPDGSRWPALNGVKAAPNLNWPPERPYSPIVGKRTMPNGEQWYEHADGTLTTTLMVWRSDLGREDALCQVFTPSPVAPLDPTLLRGKQ